MNKRVINVNGREIQCFEDGSVGFIHPQTKAAVRTLGYPDSWGYLRVHLGNKHLSIARLICEAFNGKPSNGCQCDHINRNNKDNRPENLRWVSPSENASNKDSVDNSIRVHHGVRRRDDPKLYRKIHNELFQVTVHLPNGKKTTRKVVDPSIKRFLLEVNIQERLQIIGEFNYYE